MNLLIRHIEYLLSRTDHVIIPDFGAVLAQYQKAEYDTEAEYYMPPRRNFAFNQALHLSDGMLASSIARSELISYDEANELIARQVEKLKSRLFEHKILPLGRIGTLRCNEESSISFVPFAYDCLSIATSAFAPIKLTMRQQDKARASQPPVLERTTEQHKAKTWSIAVRIAASLLVLIAVCFVASTPMQFDEAAMASLTPELRQSTIDEIVPQKTYPDYIVAYTAHPEGIPMELPVSRPNADANYYIIVASFPSQSDAQKYIDFSGDASLGILAKDNRYRVYAAAVATQKEAYSVVSAINLKYPQVWICAK